MKLSLNWITRYVENVELPDAEQLALKLTMATAEVEGVEVLPRVTEKVVVAHIVDVAPIEKSEKLSLVTVAIGKDKTLQSVCGAPNVKSGMFTLCALQGAVLSDGSEVVKGIVAGIESECILCSLKELGWGDFHLGIIELPNLYEPGTPIAELVTETDYILEIDNKSLTHRSDLWGHYGFSREVAAIYRGTLKQLEQDSLADSENLKKLAINVQDSDGCRGYSGICIANVSTTPSPAWMQADLAAVGIRPINSLVDLTNYLLQELGQPMHAFDGRFVDEIAVDAINQETTFITLDDVERKLAPQDLMIWDGKKPVALAGIMGGQNSEVVDDTTTLLLESANFKPARVRRTSVRLGLRTDSSLRFEKNLPLSYMELAIKRFLYLLKMSGQEPRCTTSLSTSLSQDMSENSISLPVDYIAQKMGIDLDFDRILEILESLEFSCKREGETLQVTVPEHRTDMAIAADILEEVARIYGYDNIQPQMPAVAINAVHRENHLVRQAHTKRFLSSAHRFIEVHSYSWFDSNWCKELGYDIQGALELKNPSAPNFSFMRTMLTPNILQLVKINQHHSDNFKLFELGHVYQAEGKGCKEHSHLAGVSLSSQKMSSTQDLFLTMKGTLEDIVKLYAYGNALSLSECSQSFPWSTKENQYEIRLDEKMVGFIGLISGDRQKLYNKGLNIVWFELFFDDLSGDLYPATSFQHPSVYPGSWMDFSILFPKDKPYSELATIIEKFQNPLITKTEFLTKFEGKGLPDGMSSYSIRYWLGRDDGTLQGEELTGFHSGFLTFLEGNQLQLR